LEVDMPAHGPAALILHDARTIVEAALKHARSSQYPPMTVAVLDSAGEPVAFAREDRSSLLRGRIATGKARGALHMGVGSRSLAARAVTHPWTLPGATTIPAPTALLIRPDGYVAWVGDGAPDLADLRETLTTCCGAADRRSHQERVVP
jgi:uncharacterized protein GlcG (DUF336 family)